MKPAVRALLVSPLFLLLPIASTSAQSTSAVAEASFAFDRPGMPVPRYKLTLHSDGTGIYHAEASSPSGAQSIDRDLTLNPFTTTNIFSLISGTHLSPEICISKAKNVANTGSKTLTYTSAGSTSACTFNYSDNKDVQQLSDLFQAIAETLDEGRTLEHLHRYDRLGLDAEMTSFASEVSAGHAIELGTIAPALTAIADDPQVIQRVRTQAAKFIKQFPPATPSR